MKNNINLTFVGDICPADMVFTKGFGLKNRFDQHNGKIWEDNFKKILENSDLSFCNLEAPLINFTQYNTDYHFAGSLEFAGFLKRCGFDIVSIANNHILEEKASGFESTIKQFEISKLRYIGKYENGSSNIESFEIKGKKFGFAAFNGVDLEKIDNPNLFAELTEQNILRAIEKMKTMNVDYKILSFHWGNEYVNIPGKNQIDLAHKLIDLGVDIIVGHHPHVIQPVEEYRGGLIIYSLGNCLFDSVHSRNTKHGLCIKVNCNKSGILSYKLVSLKLNEIKGVAIDYSLTAKSRLNKISRDYRIILNRTDYHQYYLKIKKKYRFYARISMKNLMVKRIMFGEISNKKKLIQNVISYYRKHR
jgi:gamma-polyglutamate biosynthesis protein CapA